MPSVLAVFGEGFEEIEFVTPVDLLRRAEIGVSTASMGHTRLVKGRSGLVLEADHLFNSLAFGNYDALLIPGGPGVSHLRKNKQLLEAVREFDARNAWLLAICAAPLVLKDAGVLDGRKYTAHTSALTELPEATTDQAVVVDRRLITSRGAGTALEFSLQAVASLTSYDQSRKVAVAICATR